VFFVFFVFFVVFVIFVFLVVLQHFSFVRSVRLQADRRGPAKAGHYVRVESAL